MNNVTKVPMHLPVCKEDLEKVSVDGPGCWENLESMSIDGYRKDL